MTEDEAFRYLEIQLAKKSAKRMEELAQESVKDFFDVPGSMTATYTQAEIYKWGFRAGYQNGKTERELCK